MSQQVWMIHVKDLTKVLVDRSQDVKMDLYAMVLDSLEFQEQVIPVNFLSQKACSSNAGLIQNAILDLNAVMGGILFQLMSTLDMFANIYLVRKATIVWRIGNQTVM